MFYIIIEFVKANYLLVFGMALALFLVLATLWIQEKNRSTELLSDRWLPVLSITSFIWGVTTFYKGYLLIQNSPINQDIFAFPEIGWVMVGVAAMVCGVCLVIVWWGSAQGKSD